LLSTQHTTVSITSLNSQFFTYFFTQLVWSEVFFAISCVYDFQQFQFNETLNDLYTVPL